MTLFDHYIDNSGFCILPFIHQEKTFEGRHNICCYSNVLQSDFLGQDSFNSFNSNNINIIRKSMIAGQQPTACNDCYAFEKQGGTSPRQIENRAWTNHTSTHTVVLKNFNNFINNKEISPISYDLRYSNTCTLKCRMCNSSNSSAINNEYQELKLIWPDRFRTVDNPRIIHDIPITPDIQKIYLAGGEPLVEPYNYVLLDKLSQQSPDVSILINTSLNILTPKFIEILNRFTNLTLVVSIDGVGKLNDYIRHGSKFDTVISNIKKMYHHNIIFSSCISLYNIFGICELVSYITREFPEHSHSHGINIVNDIDEVMLDSVPVELRPTLINQLTECLSISNSTTQVGINNLITVLSQNNFNPNRFTNFVKYTKILDTNRNESIIEIVPELSKYFL